MSGNINRTHHTLDQRLPSTVAGLTREMAQLKTPQKMGADVLQVQSLPTPTSVYIDSAVNPPGGHLNSHFLFVPNNSTLTLWNVLVSLYIDATLDPITGIPDAAHLYPGGGSLTPGMLNVRFETWLDWATSSDVTNSRMLRMHIVNTDSASHTYSLAFKAYLPNMNL